MASGIEAEDSFFFSSEIFSLIDAELLPPKSMTGLFAALDVDGGVGDDLLTELAEGGLSSTLRFVFATKKGRKDLKFSRLKTATSGCELIFQFKFCLRTSISVHPRASTPTIPKYFRKFPTPSALYQS